MVIRQCAVMSFVNCFSKNHTILLRVSSFRLMQLIFLNMAVIKYQNTYYYTRHVCTLPDLLHVLIFSLNYVHINTNQYNSCFSLTLEVSSFIFSLFLARFGFFNIWHGAQITISSSWSHEWLLHVHVYEHVCRALVRFNHSQIILFTLIQENGIHGETEMKNACIFNKAVLTFTQKEKGSTFQPTFSAIVPHVGRRDSNIFISQILHPYYECSMFCLWFNKTNRSGFMKYHGRPKELSKVWTHTKAENMNTKEGIHILPNSGN